MTFDEMFQLTPAEPQCWTAAGAPPTDERVVFGGLVVGQVIIAASLENRRCHSVHAYFIGAGTKQLPFEILVEKTRDGGSFSTRRVEVGQGERLLMAAYTSHHDGDPGPVHQDGMPDVSGPEGIEDMFAGYRKHLEAQSRKPRRFLVEEMMEVRSVPADTSESATASAIQATWFKPRKFVEGGQAVHQAVVAFASDQGLVRAGLQRHSGIGNDKYQTASLDHAIWFHRQVSANDWMLHVLHSPIAANGRGFSRGSIFTQDGTLVASVAQEFLARNNRTHS